MCGIVGAVAKRDISCALVTALARLEYRGYDSAGIAVIDVQQLLKRLRVAGKVGLLADALDKQPMLGQIGIAHTRWATHGKPAEHNAHPHFSGSELAVVHNGIIENYESLRERLQKAGYHFSSQTDTEVIVHLVHFHLQSTPHLLAAIQQSIDELTGAYAFAILYAKEPQHLIAVRKGSPLVIGVGQQENFIASDNLALLPLTQTFIYLEEGDIADVYADRVEIYNRQLQPVQRQSQHSDLKDDAGNKGDYTHFMLKEMFEQPRAIADNLEGRLTEHHVLEAMLGPEANAILSQTKAVSIVACGTSYHAGLVARYWIEALAGLPCQVEVASEIRYRKAAVAANTLLITISQSGETADTLAALRQLKLDPNFLAALCICNVPESSLVRESNLVLMTRAGKEIGVASTKAFTTQLVSLLMLTVLLARHQGLSEVKETDIVNLLRTLPTLVTQALLLNEPIKKLAAQFAHAKDALFLGRGTQFPIALEGALKLKEISYIHADAYPAGELKHGPLALVDENMPVIALVANDAVVDKVKSNIQEVKTRGGKIIVIADEAVELQIDDHIVIRTPSCDALIAPIIFTIPLQLLAYHVAVLKGNDVDQPRNLAKSVTVE